jgi:hypothetical protein
VTIEIPLTRGMVALVDECDAHVARLRWHPTKSRGTFYAAHTVTIGRVYVRTLKLHRVVLGVSDPLVQVDHRNGDGLDCRRENLRLAKPFQNARNRPADGDNACGFKGVHWQRNERGTKGVWRAQIRVNGRLLSLGCFATAEAAARAYDAAAQAHFGEFARTNFGAERPHGDLR